MLVGSVVLRAFFFYAFNISGTIQPKEDKSIIITPWTEITRTTHKHITLNRYHRSLIHHWPHGDTVSMLRTSTPECVFSQWVWLKLNIYQFLQPLICRLTSARNCGLILWHRFGFSSLPLLILTFHRFSYVTIILLTKFYTRCSPTCRRRKKEEENQK